MGSREPVELTFESAENIVLRWDATSSDEARDRTIFASGEHHVIDQYLNAVDEIQRSLESGTLTDIARPKLLSVSPWPGTKTSSVTFSRRTPFLWKPIVSSTQISSFKRTCSTSELHDPSFAVEEGGEGRTLEPV